MSERSTDTVIRTLSPSDQLLIDAFSAAIENGLFHTVTAYYSPSKSQGFTRAEELRLSAESVYPNLAGRRIFRMRGETKNQSRVTFERSVWDGNRPQPSQYEADFWTQKPQNQSEDDTVALIDFVHEHFSAGSQVLSPSEADGALRTTLQGMNEASLKVFRQIASTQRTADKRLQEKEDALEAAHRDRLAQLEADWSEKDNKLTQRAEQLDAREADLDNRHARHARRELRQVVTDRVKERLKNAPTSNANSRARVFVTVLALVGMGIGTISTYTFGGGLSDALAAAETAGEISITNGLLWLLAAKTIGGTTLFVVLLFYLLGYWRKIVNEDTRFERMLERYSLDMDRASWVVETVLEVNGEPDSGGVPDLWLKGVTGQLFPFDQPQQDEDETALEALGELLKKGAHLKISPNGAELDIAGPAARRVGRSGVADHQPS